MDIRIIDCGDPTNPIDRAATPEEEAQISTTTPPDPRLETDISEQAAAKQNSQITTFLNWTPAELEAWLVANIDNAPDLAAVKTGVHTALSVLGRIAINAARGRGLR